MKRREYNPNSNMAIRKAETFTVPDLLKESDITEISFMARDSTVLRKGNQHSSKDDVMLPSNDPLTTKKYVAIPRRSYGSNI